MPPNRKNSNVVFVGLGVHYQPRLAQKISTICNFYQNNWKWLLGFLVGVLELYFSFIAIK